MDTFTMLFAPALSAAEVSRALSDAGFVAREQSSDAVAVSRDDAYVWLYLTRGEDVVPADYEDEAQWQIPRDRVGMLATIAVRRNVNSEDLAVRVADELVTRFAAAILWDGMDQWESRYNEYVSRK